MSTLLAAIALLATAADANTTAVSPRAIIQRGIDAQGGEEKVAKLVNGPWRAKVKGKAGWLTITGELFHAPPNGKITTTLGPPGVAGAEVVVVTKGDRTWRRILGITGEVTGKEREEMLDGGYRHHVCNLTPLLRETGFQLSVLPEATVSAQPATGIRVQSQGHRDIDLYFDKTTGLLVKTESRILQVGKPPIVLEKILSNYRDIDGLKLAMTFTKFENKRQTSVEEYVDFQFVDHIDDREFEKP
jgi:hypothetical protein